MYIRGETGPTESMERNRIGWKKELSFEERNGHYLTQQTRLGIGK